MAGSYEGLGVLEFIINKWWFYSCVFIRNLRLVSDTTIAYIYRNCQDIPNKHIIISLCCYSSPMARHNFQLLDKQMSKISNGKQSIKKHANLYTEPIIPQSVLPNHYPITICGLFSKEFITSSSILFLVGNTH